jgi:hypothetical protein
LIQRTETQWSTNRIFALVLGIVFTLVSIIGFLTPAENSTGVQAIFGIFDVDSIHNFVHLLFGLLGIAAAFTGYARRYNQVFGVIYTVLGLLGLIPALYFPAGSFGHDNGLFLGLMHINAGDHILHLVTGLAALYIGFFHERAGGLNRTASPL